MYTYTHTYIHTYIHHAQILSTYMYICVQMKTELSPMVEVDEFSNLGLYWNRLIFLKSRPAVVCPLVSDLELSAPAMACDMPWYVCICIGTRFKALHVRMYICMYE